jgi:hypothetical protein
MLLDEPPADVVGQVGEAWRESTPQVMTGWRVGAASPFLRISW